MKVICLHHRLAGYTSHHFNEAHGFIQAFDRRGTEFVLLISVRASAQIAAELQARPVLDDPTFRMEWSFEERSRRFVAMLQAQVEPELKVNDRVLVTIATQLEAHALAGWVQALPPDKKPWIVVLFLSDRWNRAGREEYERQMVEFRGLKAAVASLAPADANRLIFCTLTDRLAEELSSLLGTYVSVAPMPLEYGPAELASPARPHPARPRVAVLGGTRREKGSYLIPEIVRACRPRAPVEFLVHLANNSLTAEEAEVLAQVAREPEVTVIRNPISLLEYRAAHLSADIGLFPYEVIPYRQRTSGVFAEAVAYGRPVVATRGTWLAEQIEAGRAAGTIFDDLHPDSIAQAIGRCVAELEALQQSARALSGPWRQRVSLTAFVDFMEEQIALRSG
jgi:glycosyltransferase involved in cell wall biosynthesis